ncbi:hypothetical protein B0H13DRAFT_1918895 [Mycena leptocephala]|nr:hypothetical protein B0H13DRAFT_1918895 [Mycena leptocephala]
MASISGVHEARGGLTGGQTPMKRLMRVAKHVRDWVEPLLYRITFIPDSDHMDGGTSGRLHLQIFRIRKRLRILGHTNKISLIVDNTFGMDLAQERMPSSWAGTTDIPNLTHLAFKDPEFCSILWPALEASKRTILSLGNVTKYDTPKMVIISYMDSTRPLLEDKRTSFHAESDRHPNPLKMVDWCIRIPKELFVNVPNLHGHPSPDSSGLFPTRIWLYGLTLTLTTNAPGPRSIHLPQLTWAAAAVSSSSIPLIWVTLQAHSIDLIKPRHQYLLVTERR